MLIERVGRDWQPIGPVVLTTEFLQITKALFVSGLNTRLMALKLRRHVFAREQVYFCSPPLQLCAPLDSSQLALALPFDLLISFGPLLRSPLVICQNSAHR